MSCRTFIAALIACLFPVLLAGCSQQTTAETGSEFGLRIAQILTALAAMAFLAMDVLRSDPESGDNWSDAVRVRVAAIIGAVIGLVIILVIGGVQWLIVLITGNPEVGVTAAKVLNYIATALLFGKTIVLAISPPRGPKRLMEWIADPAMKPTRRAVRALLPYIKHPTENVSYKARRALSGLLRASPSTRAIDAALTSRYCTPDEHTVIEAAADACIQLNYIRGYKRIAAMAIGKNNPNPTLNAQLALVRRGGPASKSALLTILWWQREKVYWCGPVANRLCEGAPLEDLVAIVKAASVEGYQPLEAASLTALFEQGVGQVPIEDLQAIAGLRTTETSTQFVSKATYTLTDKKTGKVRVLNQYEYDQERENRRSDDTSLHQTDVLSSEGNPDYEAVTTSTPSALSRVIVSAQQELKRRQTTKQT